MNKYNLKDFFKNTIVQNDEWVSNGYFIFNKSILTAGQRKMVEKYPQDIDRLNKIINIIQTTQDYFEGLKERLEFIPKLVIEHTFRDETYEILYNNELELALKLDYYNLFTSRGCKLYKGNGSFNPLAIIKDNEFVGVLLPIRTEKEMLENAISYNSYITQLKQEQEAKEELKKLNKRCLYISNNKAVVRNRPLQCITEFIPDNRLKNIFVDATPEGQHDYVEIYLDLGIIHMSINQSIRTDEIKDSKEAFLTLSSTTLKNYKEDLQERLSNNRWINIAEVKLMELAGESKEYIERLEQHRGNIKALREKERLNEELKKQQEEQEYVDSQNQIANDIITQAEQLILQGGRVINKDVTIYKDRYTSNTTSLILHMMKLYNIKVPLRTQGWINMALHSIYKMEDGEFTYDYYNSSSNSTVFNKYLNTLVDKVKEKYKNVA